MGRQITLELHLDSFPLKAPFRISGYTFTATDVLTVTLRDGDLRGRGEASGVYYLDDAPERMALRLETLREQIEAGIEREHVQALLPPGGARNALDCALWDLEAQRDGVPAWRRAGLEPLRPVVTTFTVSADTPDAMAKRARAFDQAKALKLKLTGELTLDVDRVHAVRAARGDAWIGVDGNQGFAPADLPRLLEALVHARVSLLEQPLPRGQEEVLERVDSPIPIAADESLQSLADVPSLVGRFQVANIKLDKCGGLTEALSIADTAKQHGLQTMVGCMTGSSLAMAPAFLVAQRCDYVDLDGPVFLAGDHRPAVSYIDGKIDLPAGLWGDGPVRAA